MLSLSLAMAIALATSSGVKWVPLNKANPTAQSVRREQTVPQPAPKAPSAPEQDHPVETQDPPPVQKTSVSSPSAQGPLEITCLGLGTANKLKVSTVDTDVDFSGMAGGDLFSGSGSGSSTILGSRQQDFRDQVDIRLFNGDDRIRMPRTMLPPIHGGNAGWFKLKNVVADARSIRAKAAVSLMNNPNVFVDRVTGTISISGYSGDYTGQCQAIDASAPAKF